MIRISSFSIVVSIVSYLLTTHAFFSKIKNKRNENNNFSGVNSSHSDRNSRAHL